MDCTRSGCQANDNALGCCRRGAWDRMEHSMDINIRDAAAGLLVAAIPLSPLLIGLLFQAVGA